MAAVANTILTGIHDVPGAYVYLHCSLGLILDLLMSNLALCFSITCVLISRFLFILPYCWEDDVVSWDVDLLPLGLYEVIPVWLLHCLLHVHGVWASGWHK